MTEQFLTTDQLLSQFASNMAKWTANYSHISVLAYVEVSDMRNVPSESEIFLTLAL